MLATEGAWLPSCDLPYHMRRWKFISIGGATHELLARIRASQNSANVGAFAIVCDMPLRRDMYWFPRSRGCNSCAGRGLPRHQCERGSAILQPQSCENVDLRAKLFLWASRNKKIFLREPGGGPPIHGIVGIKVTMSCPVIAPRSDSKPRAFVASDNAYAGLVVTLMHLSTVVQSVPAQLSRSSQFLLTILP